MVISKRKGINQDGMDPQHSSLFGVMFVGCRAGRCPMKTLRSMEDRGNVLFKWDPSLRPSPSLLNP